MRDEALGKRRQRTREPRCDRRKQQCRAEQSEQCERDPAAVLTQLRRAAQTGCAEPGHQREGPGEAEQQRQAVRREWPVGACENERDDRQDTGAQHGEQAAHECDDDE
jgi:hypothetical protein